MKILFTILLICFFISVSKGQVFSLRLFVTDSYDRKDTIEFGLNNTATLGIDSSFGEQDIYGQLWDTLDMRIIHRDSINHHCLMETNWWSNPLAPEIYYNINRDLKIDYRPLTWNFGTIYMSFEILIKATNPPIYITTDFSGISGDMYEGWSALHLLDSNCITLETKSIYYSGLNDTIYTSNDTLTTLVAEIQSEVSIEETNYKNINIYPNPSTGVISITNKGLEITGIEVFDIYGKEIISQISNLKSQNTSINLSQQPKGIYIIKVCTSKGVAVEKIVLE